MNASQIPHTIHPGTDSANPPVRCLAHECYSNWGNRPALFTPQWQPLDSNGNAVVKGQQQIIASASVK